MSERPKFCYNDRVGGRTSIALELLKPEHAERISKAHILHRDLEAISNHGQEAARQDGLQKDALAGQYIDLKDKAEVRDEFDALSDDFRGCIPIVALELKKHEDTGHQRQGKWLSKVSYKRFRLRLPPVEAVEAAASAEGEEPAAGSTPAEETTTPSATRVERRDRLAAARAVKQLAEALLAEGREPIVDALAERDLPRERLEWLRDQATEHVNALGGILRLRALEATKLESDAAEAQKEYWDSCRRQIRKAVVGDSNLEALWAKC